MLLLLLLLLLLAAIEARALVGKQSTCAMEATCDKPKYLSKDVGNTQRERDRETGVKTERETSRKSLSLREHVMEMYQLKELAQVRHRSA